LQNGAAAGTSLRSKGLGDASPTRQTGDFQGNGNRLFLQSGYRFAQLAAIIPSFEITTICLKNPQDFQQSVKIIRSTNFVPFNPEGFRLLKQVFHFLTYTPHRIVH
jgi:hypothetical protein